MYVLLDIFSKKKVGQRRAGLVSFHHRGKHNIEFFFNVEERQNYCSKKHTHTQIHEFVGQWMIKNKLGSETWLFCFSERLFLKIKSHIICKKLRQHTFFWRSSSRKKYWNFTKTTTCTSQVTTKKNFSFFLSCPPEDIRGSD